MNIYKCIGACVALFGLFGSVSAQLYEFPRSTPVLEDQSGLSGVGFSIGVIGEEIPSGYRYSVSSRLFATGSDGNFLQSDLGTVPFAVGESVGPGSVFYSNPNGSGSASLSLVSYSWRIQYPGNIITVSPGRDYFTNQTEIVLGFSRGHPGPVQYGWIRMRREVTRAQDMFDNQTPEKFYVFQPVDYAIHPIAEQPIRAGLPPELPSMMSSVETAEDGSSVIRISWPAGLYGMRLETTYALESPTQWTPVLDVTGNEAVFALPDEGELYFRLNYVP